MSKAGRTSETTDRSNFSTALVAYAPVPFLKLSATDAAYLPHRNDIHEAAPQLTATLVMVLMAIAQYRRALLLSFEKLERYPGTQENECTARTVTLREQKTK
jgi:hypothetical protein